MGKRCISDDCRHWRNGGGCLIGFIDAGFFDDPEEPSSGGVVSMMNCKNSDHIPVEQRQPEAIIHHYTEVVDILKDELVEAKKEIKMLKVEAEIISPVKTDHDPLFNDEENT